MNVKTLAVAPLSSSWQKWLRENIQRGCTHESLLAVMLENQFPADSAQAHIAAMAAAVANGHSEILTTGVSEKYQYEATRIASGNTIQLNDRQVSVAMRLAKPDVVVVDHFMTPAECEQLIAMAVEKCQRSGVVDPQTGETVIIPARSSEGCYFQRGENALIARLDTRISALMNWPVDHGEGIQILHYTDGGEYKPHFDYFPVDQKGSATHLAKGGQRVATLVMYLNDVAAGGETVFPDVGVSVVPRQGAAAYFSYVNSRGQLDPATLHGGAPVTAGEKWIATKWMRQNVY